MQTQATRARRMTIAFDATPLARSQKSGVDYYTSGLISSLAAAFPEQVELVGHYFNFLGKQTIPLLPQAKNIRYKRTVVLPRQIFTLLRRLGLSLPFEFFTKTRADFHLFPNFLGWPSAFRTPSAAVIHDLYYLEHAEQLSRRNQRDLQKLVPKMLRRSAFVITVSQATKQALQAAYPWLNQPVIVGHIAPLPLPAIDAPLAEQLLSDLGVKGAFILFIGTIEPRKNLLGLLQAYEMLPSTLRDKYALVVAGGKGWQDEVILQKIAELQSSGYRIIQTGYVSETQKVALYEHATVLVLPSLYEGFGIPLLEAMAYDVPILASDIPVFREVADNAALYCAPANPADIAKQLSTLLDDSTLHSELVHKGREHLKNFSWQQVSTQLLEAMQKAKQA